MVDVADDDSVQCLLEFANGATGHLEASYVSSGRKNFLSWEINGSLGSISFNLERLNELEVCLPRESQPEIVGFQNVLVTEAGHPFIHQWWPRGHTIGWEHTFVHEIQHFLRCVAEDIPVGPDGATFEDGYRAALISEAIRKSAHLGCQINIAQFEADSEK